MKVWNNLLARLGLSQAVVEDKPVKGHRRVVNTTPNKSKFNAERARYAHVSREIVDVPPELQKLGFPPRIVSGRGVTYRKEQAHA